VQAKQVELTLHKALVGIPRLADFSDRDDGSRGTKQFPRAQRLIVAQELEHAVIFEMQWVIAWHGRIIPSLHAWRVAPRRHAIKMHARTPHGVRETRKLRAGHFGRAVDVAMNFTDSRAAARLRRRESNADRRRRTR
jgi:hypothetical protein